jgi:hypothetical protein
MRHGTWFSKSTNAGSPEPFAAGYHGGNDVCRAGAFVVMSQAATAMIATAPPTKATTTQPVRFIDPVTSAPEYVVERAAAAAKHPPVSRIEPEAGASRRIPVNMHDGHHGSPHRDHRTPVDQLMPPVSPW